MPYCISSCTKFFFICDKVLGEQKFSNPIYTCDKHEYYNRILDFFPVNNFVHSMTEVCGHLQMHLYF